MPHASNNRVSSGEGEIVESVEYSLILDEEYRVRSECILIVIQLDSNLPRGVSLLHGATIDAAALQTGIFPVSPRDRCEESDREREGERARNSSV